MALVERASELTELHRCLVGAAQGHGAAVAVCGEPGAGKSALVNAACAERADLRVLRGLCDPLTTPRPLGPIRDVARSLRLPLPAADLSLAAVCESLHDALADVPSVLVVEDLHWADEASVEVLRYLARRVASLPLALVVTYRDQDMGPQHSTRPLLGDFAALDRLATIRLQPLSAAAVDDLLAGSGLDAQHVLAVTGGNPFFVTEVAKDPSGPLPASVRDAVLARAADVAPADFEMLQLAAMAPDGLEDRVLPALEVSLPVLRRLDATGLLMRTERGLVFRHELARLAVESTVPPGGAAVLHARLLAAVERVEPADPAVLTHHAVAAGDAVRAARYAEAAATEAARAGSHTEAVSFLTIALAHLAPDRTLDRASLLARLSYEEYMSNRLDSAIEKITATFPLWNQLGDTAGLSAAHGTAAVFEYYNARRDAAEEHAALATETARSTSRRLYGAARATSAYLAFQRNDLDLADAWGREAAQVAAEEDDRAVALRTSLTQAAAGVSRGVEGAREEFVEVIRAASEEGMDELVSTAYSNLSNLDVEQRRLGLVESVLQDGLAHTLRRGIPICNHWQTGVRARQRLLQGQWAAAVDDADQVIERSGMRLALLWPQVVRGLVDLRRSGSDGGHLDEAWKLAEALDEPLRRLPVLAGLAERVWMTGRPDERVTRLAVELMEPTVEVAASWGMGDLAVWLRRLDLLTVPVTGVAEPYALALDGRYVDAAHWWRGCGAAFDEAMTLADCPDQRSRARAVELLDRLGAAATADRVRADMRRDGAGVVPARPRESTLGNPAGLTNRQLDVARLIADGLTNAEIAERLFISPKTADHHVSAILTKLGLPNRRAVAQWVASVAPPAVRS